MEKRTEQRAAVPEIERVAQAAREADFVLVGASNGMDMAEGLDIFRPTPHFLQAYGDFAQRYGISSILEGLARPWADQGVRWAFLARFAQTEWLDYRPSVAMTSLQKIIGDRAHFILTCNVDGRFVRAGFDPQNVLETEGTIRELVCSAGCSQERVPAEAIMRNLARKLGQPSGNSDASGRDVLAGPRVPKDLIPRCEHCGAPMEPAMDEMRTMHPDPAFRQTTEHLAQLLRQAHGKNVLVLELGVGPRNDSIRMPMAELALYEPHATYAALSLSVPQLPAGLGQKGVGVRGDLAQSLQQISELLS